MAAARPVTAFVTLALTLSHAALSAEDAPTFRIVFKAGSIAPARLEVPARTRFRLELVNEDEAPAEFESVELHKEKVLAPQSQTVMVVRTLDPGEYAFFDDFHPGSKPAILVAK